MGLRIWHKTNSIPSALRAAALIMMLLDTVSVVKDELALQTNEHRYILIIPLSIQKIGWRQRNVFVYESLFTRSKSDVRQGTTNRGSASIANLVAVEVQYLQRLVLAANQT
jgi:hypothetical protein